MLDLFADSGFGLRELIRLVLISGLLTAACVSVFPRSAPTRRAFMLIAALTLLALPWVLASTPLTLPYEVDSVPNWYVELSMPSWLLAVWVLPALFFIGWRLRSVIRVQLRLHVANAEITHDRVRQGLDQVCATLGLSEVPRLVTAERPDQGPASATLFGPVVVLPHHAKDWTPSTLKAVLLHECVHIQRRDDMWLLLMRLVAAFYWWLPWIRLLERQFECAVEESCDDLASIHHAGDATYLDGVVDGAKHCVAPRDSALAQLNAHPLVARIRRFADWRDTELDSGGVYWALIAVLATVVLLTSVQPVVTPVVAQARPGIQLLDAIPQSVVSEALVPMVTTNLTDESGRRVHFGTTKQPIYPGAAILEGVEGEVLIEFQLGRYGDVYQPKILRSEPADVFDAAALSAIKQTRFTTRPQQMGVSDRPQTMVLRQHYYFRLAPI